MENILFGPVNSRRLGRSLGVDLIPYKTCPLNCIYCECGLTTNLSLKREEFFPLDKIKNELDGFLTNQPSLDFITLAGSGEPTLYKKMGELIAYIKNKYPYYKIALLTNGVLFFLEELRREVKKIDLLLPSLDAATQKTFELINRPLQKIEIDKVIEGLVSLRNEHPGQIWLELFVVPGINDQEEELTALKKAILKIRPDRIQLNTLDRPAPERHVRPASLEILEGIRNFFSPLETEIIASSPKKPPAPLLDGDIKTAVLEMIRRRPCTVEDIFVSTGYPKDKISAQLNLLQNTHNISVENGERGDFYFCRN